MDTNQKNPLPPSPTGSDFSSFFNADDILCNPPIESMDELLKEMVARLVLTKNLKNKDDILSLVRERENQETTAIANGVAVPHARIDKLDAPLVAVATSRGGIVFHADKPKVHLVILVLVPKDRPAVYLQIVSALSRILRDKDAPSTAASLSSAEEIHSFFQRGGLVLPAYVCAGDIMSPVKNTLRDNNGLKDAIDFFVTHNSLEVPVVDKDGDLVGIVSAAALLKVCMPDYILWMDDLSPMLNFEPFVTILKNESNTWLKDIMTSEDLPVLKLSDPAIAVAETMAKRNCSVCYVVKDSKLMGKITLPHFLNKVLRD